MKYIPRYIALACCTSLLFAGCAKKADSDANQSSDQAQSASGKSAAGTASDTPASGRAVEITADDTMKFSLTEIRAKRGEPLSVTLRNVGSLPKFSMGHNWVLFKKGVDVEAFVNEAMTAATTDYIPASREKDIIRHTKLLGPKESDTATFNAPDEPGQYTYICSFPGHYQVGMRGVLIVE